MSENQNSNQGSAARFRLPPSQPPEVHPQERARVEQLIADGKSGKAVDLAKDVHQRRQSAASETLLLDAYGARISSLAERSLERDARALMDLVLERYPSARNRAAEWNAVFAIKHGDLDTALAPLNDSSLAPEKQAAIASLVRRDAVDLRALSESRVLPLEHPWRIAAAALLKAFEAVTSGPVAEEALALPEVSRQNPLAPWKLLIRAIAAYYRREDSLCEKYLTSVEPGSAAARLVPALRALTHQKIALTPAASALVGKASGNTDILRDSLKRLDQAFRGQNHQLTLQEIRNAVTACRESEPALRDRLKQHISIRAMLASLKPDKVAAAMGGPSLKNAYFWRLMARAFEDKRGSAIIIPHACSLWEEFRKHAVREGWFPANGPEVAALYLHIADLWRRLSEDEVEETQNNFVLGFDNHAQYYSGQPPEIRALMPKGENPDLYFLSPFYALERACQADPRSENFKQWLRTASTEFADSVAERWCEALPNDIPPLIHLMESAERRNALQKAFKFMERAERIDGLNPEVRRARLRLLVSMAARHLREKKAHLAERELRQLEALAQAQQGDRPAFVAAMRWARAQLSSGTADAVSARAEVVKLMGGELATQVVLAGVSQHCGLRSSEPAAPKGEPLAAGIGRACALGDDMGVPFNIPHSLLDRLSRELSTKGLACSVPALAALGEAAVRQELFAIAYAVGGAGLRQSAEGQARFLFLRARGLPPWEEERRSSCLRAASELAQRQRDSDLLNRIGEWRDEELEFLGFLPEAEVTVIGAEEIGRVVQREIKLRDYPKSRPVPSDDDDCQCPACCARRGQMPRELEEMMDQLGPEAVLEAMADMFGMGEKKKSRKRRTGFADDSDLLF